MDEITKNHIGNTITPITYKAFFRKKKSVYDKLFKLIFFFINNNKLITVSHFQCAKTIKIDEFVSSQLFNSSFPKTLKNAF